MPDDAPSPAVITSPLVETLLAEQPLPNYALGAAVAARGPTAVFRADDRRLERTVALKVMAPARAPGGEAVERFFNEARAVARVRDDTLARALDVGRAGPYFFFASAWMKAGSLADRTARRASPRWRERETLAVVADVARGLRAMFEHGLVHRRLSPGNILYDDAAKRWRLGDVGCDTDILHDGDPAAAARADPAYAAPERFAGDLNADARGDLYALGAIWYALLLGAPPFAGATPEEAARRHAEETPEAPRDRDPRLSSATSRLVLWLLEKDRDDRPRTPQELIAKLRQHPLLAEADAGGRDDGGEDGLSGNAASDSGADPDGGEDADDRGPPEGARSPDGDGAEESGGVDT